MERLTEYEVVGGHVHAVPTGDIDKAMMRLAEYEDTGMTPEEISDLDSVREISPEAEYAINKHADSIIARLDKLLQQEDDDIRLRELAEADKDGRVVVLPCKPGDTVYMNFCGEIIEKRVGQFHVNSYTRQRLWADLDCDWASTQRVRWDLAAGKTVFLTREEAEKALEEEKDD